ncbi:MAG: DUF4097 family beta strand repeat-containing protein [Myxococcota bacterium]
MTLRRRERSGEICSEGGLSGFVRDLLSNIPWSERLEREETLDIEAPESRALRVYNSNGRTAVWGEERDDIEARITKIARAESEEGARELLDEIRVTSTDIAGALELDVEIPRKWNRRGSVNLEIRMPRDLSVELSSENGRLDVEGVQGAVSARSSNGAAVLRNIVGDVDVATSNAKVFCSHTCGLLVARSRNGKIELEEHSGSIDASTSNSSIRASVHEIGDEGVQLATSNGPIVLALPDRVDCEIDVRVDNGTIRNDRQLCQCTRESNGRVVGRLGDGGALVKLRTSNGSIALR